MKEGETTNYLCVFPTTEPNPVVGRGGCSCSERLCRGPARRAILMGSNFHVYVGHNALEVISVRFGHIDSVAYEARAFPYIDQGALHAGPNLAKFS